MTESVRKLCKLSLPKLQALRTELHTVKERRHFFTVDGDHVIPVTKMLEDVEAAIEHHIKYFWWKV